MPPLNALRAFEVAARTGSFTAAGKELGVSSAAVSQQVKLLEEFWQQALFIRQGNRLSLTEAGQSAYPQLAQSMTGLTALSERMQHKQPRSKRLVLSAPHSVAETWLAARLSPAPEAPDLGPISIRIEEDPVDFVQDRIDLRIFFGHDLYGDYQVDRLFADVLCVVASSGFLHAHGADIAQIPDHLLIHTHWGRGFVSSPNWQAVFQGRRSLDPEAGLSVQSSSTALNLARHGLGAALVPLAMAQDDLAAGRVRRIPAPEIPLAGDYRIAYPKRLRHHPALMQVLQRLSTHPA